MGQDLDLVTSLPSLCSPLAVLDFQFLKWTLSLKLFFNMLCLLPAIPEPNLPLSQKGLLVRKVSFSFLSGICHSEMTSCFSSLLE